MKMLPNSLKYLHENDEIVAKDIPQKYICTMVELKKRLTLTATIMILSTSQSKKNEL